LSQPKSINC